MKHSFILSFLLFLADPASSQTIVSKKLDSVLAGLSKSTDPGFSVAVLQHGQIKYAKAHGMADIARQRKITVYTPFNIGSASKQFAAASIYLLEQRGKLNTNDKLSKFFPEFPAYADTITIAHLIHHQSGLRDYITLLWMGDMSVVASFGDSAAYGILSRQKALNFHPGDEYSYSNSGYFLLSLIVKQVSGQDLQEFAYKNIFKPLKMKHTGFSHSHQVRNKANGYALDGSTFSEYNPTESTIGHSHVYSAATDWQEWFKEMKNHKLLGDAVWKKMLIPASTNTGMVTDYAGGLVIGNYKDKSTVSHGGYLYGYHSEMTWFPKEDLGIMVLTNNDGLSASSVLNATYNTIYRMVKPDEQLKPKLAVVETPVTIDTNRYTGTYRFNENSEKNFEVTIANSQLNVNQLWNQVEYPIAAVNDSLFYIDGNTGISFTFRDMTSGKANKIVITQNDKLTHLTRLTKALAPDSETIKASVGRYYNDEIDAYYTVFEDKGTLKIKIGESALKTVRTGEKESYNIPDNGMNFVFNRDKNGIIDGLDLVHSRVKNLHFVKKPLLK